MWNHSIIDNGNNIGNIHGEIYFINITIVTNKSLISETYVLSILYDFIQEMYYIFLITK